MHPVTLACAGWLACLPTGLWAEEAPLAPSEDMLAATVRVAGFLIFFIAVALLAGKFAKRINPALGSGPIEVVGGRGLAPGVGVRLIRVGDRHFLVGFTREQVTLLAEIQAHELPGSEVSP
ncbi:MAG: FliO/MopB family protein [Magnetococcales bacterium]|nr:FliO/MopB family protein [Magnetococcales bacterium]MBF0613503.1 FliO/MopB family protein [Magnetococcales bacterium]NGZ25830.1 FliO/MopB family protein [Magnetococcales bacterium]